jgi:inner membrane protein
MKIDALTIKLLIIGVIGLVCFIASLFVFGLVEEREGRHTEAENEIGQTWGAPQVFIGPMLVIKNTETGDTYILPNTLSIESSLEPEVRKRGIFETVIYKEHLKVSGSFSASDVTGIAAAQSAIFTVSLSDARSIEKQVALNWNKENLMFNPGANASLFKESGIHVPVLVQSGDNAFSFELTLNGNKKAMFAPVGRENEIKVSASWGTPQFIGAFLPSTREVTTDSFNATWKVSSFGRNYAQNFVNDGSVTETMLTDSTFGVELNEGVNLYTQVSRSIKYAILFIAVTFMTFFLFEVLSGVSLHAFQYLLVGIALSLFYLLLLSLSEHIGFLKAYVIATGMISILISAYSSKILGKGNRALAVFVLLIILYGYLYFILNLEDYALLFGSLLLFGLLASVMYLTRNIKWSSLSER